MAQVIDKAYLQEQFRLFLNYLKSTNVINVDTSVLETRISALESTVANSGNETLASRISTLETDVSSLKSSVSDLDSAWDHADERISELEVRTDIYVGNTAPTDNTKVWIDTSAS